MLLRGHFLTKLGFVSSRFRYFSAAYCTVPLIKSVILDSPGEIPPEKIGRRLLKKMTPSLLDVDKVYASILTGKKDETTLKLTFLYDFPEKKNEEMVFIRELDSYLSSTFERMSLKFHSTVAPKRKRFVVSVTESLYPLEMFKIKNKTGQVLDPTSVQNSSAFVEGNTFHIGDRIYDILTNIPYFKKFKISTRLLVGFPIVPSLEMEGASSELSSFYWFVENNPDNTSDPTLTKTGLKISVKGYTLKSTDMYYVPSVDDVDKRLCLVCVPRGNTVSGIPAQCCPLETIEQIDDEEWMWSERHNLCATVAPNNVLRIVDYNILADMYLELEKKVNQKDLWYPYCPREFQMIDYRYPLLLREILGYNGDLICLQETEIRFWKRAEPFFKHHGFGGVLTKKGGDVNEGAAIFYRLDKLKLLESNDLLISTLTEKNNAAGYEDLAKVCKQDVVTEKLFVERPTVLQVALFQSLAAEHNNTLILVCNTHFHFHPKHTHIRLLQAALCLRYVEKFVADVKQKNPSSKVAVVFCGDFNSNPRETVYQMMLTGQLSANDEGWSAGSTETAKFNGIDFKTSLHFKSACCPVQYTNFLGSNGFSACLDYIFINDDVLEVSRRFPMPKQELVEKYVGLPSKISPSDHLPIMCELKFK